jgi:hypothetical protein
MDQSDSGNKLDGSVIAEICANRRAQVILIPGGSHDAARRRRQQSQSWRPLRQSLSNMACAIVTGGDAALTYSTELLVDRFIPEA